MKSEPSGISTNRQLALSAPTRRRQYYTRYILLLAAAGFPLQSRLEIHSTCIPKKRHKTLLHK
jgi:hypothetical protein